MRQQLLIISVAVLAGCQQVSKAADQTISPPEAYAHFDDRFRAQLLHWGIPWKQPCVETSGHGDGVAASITPDDQCFKFLPPKRYVGLWRDDPRGSRFCPAPANECTQSSAGTKIRMEADYPVVQLSERGSNALYKVDFIGRMTAHRGVYNHLQFGNYEQEVFAGRMIALQELQPPQNSNDDGPLK